MRNGAGSAFMQMRQTQLEELRAQLTEEQVTELDALIATLREEGKTPAEVHEAVGAKLVEFGLTLPDTWNETPAGYAAANRLTEEQRTELHALMQQLIGEGATRDEIRAAVAAKYDEWGKVMPGRRGPDVRQRGFRGNQSPAAETTETVSE